MGEFICYYLPQSVELRDLKLCMLGTHQLRNAMTAACAALCLRDQGEAYSMLFFVLFEQYFIVDLQVFHAKSGVFLYAVFDCPDRERDWVM